MEGVREWLWGSPAFFSMTKVTLFFVKNFGLIPQSPLNNCVCQSVFLLDV